MARRKPSTVPKKNSRKAAAAHVELCNLVGIQQGATKRYKHAENTRKSYQSAVSCAIRWIHKACEDNPKDEIIRANPRFRDAFEGRPQECSGKALAMYITYKCFEQGCGLSTGTSAYSALKKYWEES
jgi:hypothetical protein